MRREHPGASAVLSIRMTSETRLFRCHPARWESALSTWTGGRRDPLPPTRGGQVAQEPSPELPSARQPPPSHDQETRGHLPTETLFFTNLKCKTQTTIFKKQSQIFNHRMSTRIIPFQNTTNFYISKISQLE